MGKTIAEKILQAHALREVQAQEEILCRVDFCYSQDGTSALVIDSLHKLKGIKLLGKSKYCMVIDHNSPSPRQEVSNVHKKMREFARKNRVKLYDIGQGISHQIIVEEGLVLPGDLVVGADSHTCTLGALNAFATGFGSTDLAMVVASGKNWFRVPETIKIIVEGTLPKAVYAKDIILYIIGKIGSGGANYKAIEFYGEAIDSLDIEERLTITNMVVEMGAKCGFMKADEKLFRWLKKRSSKVARGVRADKDAKYSDIKEYNVSKLTPQIAKPHSVDNVASINQVAGKPIDVAFLGTCTNGRISDLEIAAQILRGRKINPDVKFIVTPASRNIYLEALKRGILEVFIDSGASVITPGCGPCVGTHAGVPSDGETVISTANRNFMGRMGNPKAFIYLASAASVAASAIKGKITDPRQYIGG